MSPNGIRTRFRSRSRSRTRSRDYTRVCAQPPICLHAQWAWLLFALRPPYLGGVSSPVCTVPALERWMDSSSGLGACGTCDNLHLSHDPVGSAGGVAVRPLRHRVVRLSGHTRDAGPRRAPTPCALRRQKVDGWMTGIKGGVCFGNGEEEKTAGRAITTVVFFF